MTPDSSILRVSSLAFVLRAGCALSARLWFGTRTHGLRRQYTDRMDFWSRVVVGREDECWLWVGPIHPGGYGKTSENGKKFYAHRRAYELTYGPIPPGLDIDHVCHNQDPSCEGGDGCLHRRCCNPAHLRAATRSENLKAGRTHCGYGTWQAAKTHCPRGHLYDEENTQWRTQWSNGRLKRACAACNRLRHRQQDQA